MYLELLLNSASQYIFILADCKSPLIIRARICAVKFNNLQTQCKNYLKSVIFNLQFEMVFRNFAKQEHAYQRKNSS